MTDVLIVGAGIGGVATALSLARHGIASLVFEAAPQLGEIGAGIQLGPNAFHAFDHLGLGEEIRKGAVFVEGFRLMDSMTGEEIVRYSLGEPFRRRFNNPYAVVHRADLHASLVQRCLETGLVELRTGHRAFGYRQDASSVTVEFVNQPPATGKLLIGADGIRSAIRSLLVKDGEPRVSGHTTFRSVIPTENMPEDLRWNDVTLWAGEKCHIVHYPLKEGRVFNLVVTYQSDVQVPVGGVPTSVEAVREGFAHIAPRARKIIEHGADWKMWVLCDRDPTDRWVDGRVALLGDAAHPTLQYFAQGACMAIEDAVCLGNIVHRIGPDQPQSLIEYQNERLVRTARVQVGSRLIGDHIYHPKGASAIVRDAAMQSLGNEGFYDFMSWLYDKQKLAA